MRSMSATSCLRPATEGASPSMASSSFMRVSGVRRSRPTPASISVRWERKRRMRSRMTMNAAAAWRTSAAPDGRKSGTSRPLPNSSATAPRRRIGRTWLRMNTDAIAKKISDEPIIHIRKI